MSKLWREKTSCKRPDEEWNNITEILPYERLYETLTQEQLLELLRDVKRLRWQVLDLHRCGLETLPPELGDLLDLWFLDLGNGRWSNDKFGKAAENSFSNTTWNSSMKMWVRLPRLALTVTRLSMVSVMTSKPAGLSCVPRP